METGLTIMFGFFMTVVAAGVLFFFGKPFLKIIKDKK